MKSPFASLLLVALLSTPALAANLTTVAGTGTAGYSGDGGAASAATLNLPHDVALAPNGDVFIADFNNLVVRRIDAVTGTITTAAGNGSFGDIGDGGPATAASMGNPIAVETDSAGNLYITDLIHAKVRRVDAATGVITTVAGNGSAGYTGDGGPATAASLNQPQGLAIDAAGNVFIADSANAVVRRVDAVTGIITTVVGNGIPGSSGDGGPAVSASLFAPNRIAFDPAGNLYVNDVDFLVFAETVRRVDAVTQIITTVAGGGVDPGPDGVATDISFLNVTALAADTAGNVFIGSQARIYRLDTATGMIFGYAGTGVAGFSGDGGPALAAQTNQVNGLAVDAFDGTLYFVDTGNQRVRLVEGTAPPSPDVVVDADTSQAALDAITQITGHLDASGTQRTDLTLSNLTDVGGNVSISDNLLLGSVVAPSLLSVGGDLTVTGNPELTSIDFGDLTDVQGSIQIESVDGEVDFGSVTSAGSISIESVEGPVDFSGVTTVPGSIEIESVNGEVDFGAVTSAASISIESVEGPVDFSGVTTVPGSIEIESVDGEIDFGSVTTAGSISIESVDGTIDFGSLTDVGDDLSVNDTGLIGFSAPNLFSAGDVVFTLNPAIANIDLPTVTNAGSISITDNPSLTGIDLGSLTNSEAISITNDPNLTTLDLGSLTDIGDNLSINETGLIAFSAPNLFSAGDVVFHGNPSIAGIHMPTVTSAGSISITQNPELTVLDLASLTDTGPISITQNPDLEVLDLGALEDAGPISIEGADTVLDLSSLTTSGEISIRGAESALDMGNLETVDGDLVIEDNDLTVLDLTPLSHVQGSVSIESNGDLTVLDLTPTVTGSMAIESGGETLTLGSADGETSVVLANLEASASLVMSQGTFTTPTIFDVNHVPPATLVVESGTDADGNPALVTPVAAYHFAFTVPLQNPAQLTLEVDIDALDSVAQTVIRGALAIGLAAVAVKADDPGAEYSAYPLCEAAESPEVDDCAIAVAYDYSGDEIPVDQPGVARVQFFVAPTSFSTWAIVAVEPAPEEIEVDVDIRPWFARNAVFTGSKDVLPVAILGSSFFDASEVDASTLVFGPNAAAPVHSFLTDVNGDGFTDHFSAYVTSETGIAFGDLFACVSGETVDGTPLTGCDAIWTACGLGFELTFLLPPLMWLRSRRRRH